MAELKLTLPSTERVDPAQGSIFFVGTATVLLRFAGFTLLTDPNFLHAGDHVHLGYGMTSARRTNPAIDIDQLPPLDAVVLSHLHGDHFDQVAEARLDHSVPILTTHEAAHALRSKGFRATYGMATWDRIVLEKADARLRLTSMPGRHGPGLVSALLPSVMGSMLEFGRADETETWLRLYVSGDTLIHDQLREIPRRYPQVDVALLHLGGTRILGVLLTMDARQGVEAIRIVKPRVAIPIHYDDYPVFKSTLADFAREVAEAGMADRVAYLERGETFSFDIPPERRGRAREPEAELV
jgi:L-ascorbate metabolism protein UlaG (beta-lactamase superfamily)